MRDALDRVSWPARRWLADRIVGRRAYSRNVAAVRFNYDWNFNGYVRPRAVIQPFDQESA